MHSPERDEVEQIAIVVDLQAKKLEKRGLTLSAALLRIAHVDLQMRIHGSAEAEVDVFSFALDAINQAGTLKSARAARRTQTR
jgi:hypothetical protein